MKSPITCLKLKVAKRFIESSSDESLQESPLEYLI